MAIKTIKEPDIYLTEAELTRLRYDYDRSFTHYVGPVPSFEEFVRRRVASRADTEKKGAR